MLQPFFKNEDGSAHAINKQLEQLIHQQFGKLSGLLINDYLVHFDPHLVDFKGTPIDSSVNAGKVIHIFIRPIPIPEQLDRFNKVLKHVFSDRRIKEFLRPGNKLVLRSNAIKWYNIEERFIDLEPIKRRRIQDAKIEVITQVKMTDNATGRSVTVGGVNASAFDLVEEARKRLYGDE